MYRVRARLAQSVERWTLNPTVVGSSPTLGASFAFSVKYEEKIFLTTWNNLNSGFYDSRFYYFLEIELKWLS